MNYFFTADTHFGHRNIVKYSNRPFKDVEEMDEEMVKRWNSVIGIDDTVYHLGDVYLCSKRRGNEIIHSLNGNINLIVGNHDRHNLKDLTNSGRFSNIADIDEITIEGTKVVLCHYAMRIWNKSHHGSYHLYGHSHGSLPDDPHSLSFDVGVDCHDYYPITWDRVKQIIDTKKYKPIDHHVGDSNNNES